MFVSHSIVGSVDFHSFFTMWKQRNDDESLRVWAWFIDKYSWIEHRTQAALEHSLTKCDFVNVLSVDNDILIGNFRWRRKFYHPKGKSILLLYDTINSWCNSYPTNFHMFSFLLFRFLFSISQVNKNIRRLKGGSQQINWSTYEFISSPLILFVRCFSSVW